MLAADTLTESAARLSLSTDDYADALHETAYENGYTHQQQQQQPETAGVNLAEKHPLENEWAFWYDKRPAQGKRVRGEQESYESNLREIGHFSFVEDFWRYYNHMMKPSRIESNSNYHFFKMGIKPMWEDSSNVKGGKWVLTMKGENKALVDSVWENVVLALVGETIDLDNEICGAVFSKRKTGDRIALWNRNRDNQAAIMNIGSHLRALLGNDASKVNIAYQNHEDSIKTGASYTNPARYKI